MLELSKRLAGAAALVAGLAIATGAAMPAAAQQVIKMTFISGFPPALTTVGGFVDGYVPEVNRLLAAGGKYKIDWNLAHSGQIVKTRGEPEGVQSGLGDITHVTTIFHIDRLPLYKVPYVTPFTTKDPGLMADIYNDMQAQFPDFGKLWDALDQVNIGSAAVVDNYIVLSKEPIKTLAGLRGKKMAMAGANIPWVLPLGVTGVTSDIAAFYQSLATGVTDTAMLWPQAMSAFKICEPAPYVLDADIGAASIHSLTVNATVWKNLPEEVKTALREASPVWGSDSLRRLVDGAAAGYERCKNEFKAEVTRLSDAERTQWAKSLPPLGLDWAKEMDSKGLPGSKLLTFYMDALRAAKQPVARDWDKE